MINNISKPIISDNFTIDDIHKIRLWHYKKFSNATLEEEINYVRKIAKKVENEIEEIRKENV